MAIGIQMATRGFGNSPSQDPHKKLSTTPKGKFIREDGSKLLPENFVLCEYDVLCGRGSTCFNNPGNVNFRKFIATQISRYSVIESKLGKTALLCEIVTYIRSLCGVRSGGGFIKKIKSSGRYIEVGDFLAREKVSQAFRDALYDQYRSSNAFKKSQRIIKEQARKKSPKGASSVCSDGLSVTQNPINEDRLQVDSASRWKKISTQEVSENSHLKAGIVESYAKQTTYPTIPIHQVNLAASHQESTYNTMAVDSQYYQNDKVPTIGLERDLNSTTNYSNSYEMRFTPDKQHYGPLEYTESTQHGLTRRHSLDMWDKFTEQEAHQNNLMQHSAPNYRYINASHQHQSSSLAASYFASSSVRNATSYSDSSIAYSLPNNEFGLAKNIQPICTNHQLSGTQRQLMHEREYRIPPSLNSHEHENRNSDEYHALKALIRSYEHTNAEVNNAFEPIPLPTRRESPKNDDRRKSNEHWYEP